MSNESLGYEIQETKTQDGSVSLTLIVEGISFAHASVTPKVLDELHEVLGLEGEAVIAELRKTLLKVLKTQGQFVELENLKEDPNKELRYQGQFIYRLQEEISTGLVWYDVTESKTGPDSIPAVVRNKMRHEVHRMLTDPNSAARALVDLDK